MGATPHTPSLRRLEPVPHKQVVVNDSFWAPRLDTNRRVTLPIEYRQCKKTGRIDAWKLDWKPGRGTPPHIFWDSDVAKWIEAVGHSLATHPDPRLERLADRVIDLIVKAQQPDGYLNVHFTVVAPAKRWTNLQSCHELYCAGHLIEAAVAYYDATGKRRLLDALCRYADLIGRVFGPGKGQQRGYPGHEEIELALVKLYRATGEPRYLALSRFFVDARGRRPHYYEQQARARGENPASAAAGAHAPFDYVQAHAPVREQTAADGHAVRAGYLYAGMADVAAETGDKALLGACRRLWRNIVDRRMYVTGGVGSAHHGERFTFDYDLPNETAYAETCAAIALVFFAHRMLQIDADAQYADVMERALYNGVLSGISLDGERFFYTNPLAQHPDASGYNRWPAERPPWFGCACCPPNVARLLASLGGYVYSTSAKGREAWVHLYVGGEATLDLAGRHVTLRQKTAYPWRDTVRLTVEPEQPTAFALALRIPGWCRGATIRVNGRVVRPTVRKGYARLRRQWRRGDRVELVLPMPVQRIHSHPKVRENAGRVALQRGPVVYCLEEVDNGQDLHNIVLPRDANLRSVYRRSLLGGCTVLTGRARRVDPASWNAGLYAPAGARLLPVSITAVPYALWANRQPGEMRVWLREHA